MAMTSRPAVFFDKDGTLVEDVPYNADPAHVVLAPGAGAAVAGLAAGGYAIVVISNQSGVARGFFDEAALDAVSMRVRELVERQGGRVDAFFYCPHHPDGGVPEYARACDCRKPAPGLLTRAAADLQLDLGASWLVGDILDDVAAGRGAGCRTVLVDGGGETLWERAPDREPHFIVSALDEAAGIILAEDGR